MTDLYTFADNYVGLVHALETTLHLRRFGFKTRLATRGLTTMTRVHTVVAVPPFKPTRAERGCFIGDRHGKNNA